MKKNVWMTAYCMWGMYGISRGYRAPDSSLQYKTKKYNYGEQWYKTRRDEISFKQKLASGICEGFFYFVPGTNLFTLYQLYTRMEIYSKRNEIDIYQCNIFPENINKCDSYDEFKIRTAFGIIHKCFDTI